MGNKSDQSREVPEDEARAWCSRKGYIQNYFETSGLQGFNVDQMFARVLKLCQEQQETSSMELPASLAGAQGAQTIKMTSGDDYKRSLIVQQQQQQVSQKKGCC